MLLFSKFLIKYQWNNLVEIVLWESGDYVDRSHTQRKEIQKQPKQLKQSKTDNMMYAFIFKVFNKVSMEQFG